MDVRKNKKPNSIRNVLIAFGRMTAYSIYYEAGTVRRALNELTYLSFAVTLS